MKSRKRNSVFSAVLEILYPNRCAFCGELTGSLMHICENCRSALSWAHIVRELPKSSGGEGFLCCRAPFVYTGLVRKGILDYKFHNREEAFRGFSLLLAEELREFARQEQFDSITNVPVSAKRKREREFDQAERIARETGSLLGIPYLALLKKIRDTRPQHTLPEKERKVNLKGAYCAPKPQKVKGKKILLIDDVITTGSTLLECAGVLFEAGADFIGCGVLASSEKCIPDVVEKE